MSLEDKMKTWEGRLDAVKRYRQINPTHSKRSIARALDLNESCIRRAFKALDTVRTQEIQQNEAGPVDNTLINLLEKHHLSYSELTAILESSKQVDRRSVSIDLGKTGRFRFLVISDTHIGQAKFDQPTWDLAVKVAKRDRCEFILHPGDHLEGMSGRPGHVYELAQIGFQAQAARCEELYKQFDIPMYGIAGNHDCVSYDTEVFTSRGWKTREKLIPSDSIMTFNLDKNKGEWNPIEAVHDKPFSGKLNRISTATVDFLGTDGHRILHKKREVAKANKYSGWKYEIVSKLSGRIRIPCSAPSGNEEEDISDPELQLVGWFLTDGHIHREKSTHVGNYVLYQSKTSEEIRRILANLGYEYSEATRQRKITQICGRELIKPTLPETSFRLKKESAKLFGYLLPNKKIQNWMTDLSDRQFRVLLDAMILGDGNVPNHSDNCAALHGKKEMLDDIQALCVTHGIGVSMVEPRPGDFKLNIIFDNDGQCFDAGSTIVKEPYVGKVWCLTVPNSNFLVRRNGKAYFTGNCWYKAKGDMGIEVCADLQTRMPEHFHNLGEWEGTLNVSGVKIMMFHANDGTSYANSYKGQKLIESLLANEKPNLLFEGHYHKSLYQYVRGVHQWESGTLCRQTGFMRGKKLAAHVGFWRVEIEHQNGKVIGVESKWYSLPQFE